MSFKSTSSLAMYPDEVAAVDEAFAYLSLVTATPPRHPPTPLSTKHVEAIIHILGRWPSSQRFPGTIVFNGSFDRMIKFPSHSRRSQSSADWFLS